MPAILIRCHVLVVTLCTLLLTGLVVSERTKIIETHSDPTDQQGQSDASHTEEWTVPDDDTVSTNKDIPGSRNQAVIETHTIANAKTNMMTFQTGVQTNYEGAIEWMGCRYLHNQKITGVRSVCFDASGMAVHCVSIVDIQQPEHVVNEEVEVTLEWAQSALYKHDFVLLMKQEGKYDWVPVKVMQVYENDMIKVNVFTREVWATNVNTSHVKFKKYFPRSLLLEQYGGKNCDVQNKSRYQKAIVDCKPVYLDIEENPNYALVLSGVKQRSKTPSSAYVHKGVAVAGETIEPYFEWYNRGKLQNRIPATVDGLKFWTTRYLLSFPRYVPLNENCQKFESGLYMAIASNIEANLANEKRRQGYSLPIERFSQKLAGLLGDGSWIGSSGSSSQSSGTTGTNMEEKLCQCGLHDRKVTGQDDKNERTHVCVSDFCTICKKCPTQCRFNELLTA